MRIFRLRSLSAANATAAVIGGDRLLAVLPADPLHAGRARLLRDRDRRRLRHGHVHDHRVLERGAAAGHPARRPPRADGGADSWTRSRWPLFTQLPVDGHYFWDLFPGLLISGVGLALSFVPVTIAGLTGVRRADAGIASGLINTSRQVGGAVGLAAVTTIAASYASDGGVPPGWPGWRPWTAASPTASRPGSPSWPPRPCSGAVIAAALLRTAARGRRGRAAPFPIHRAARGGRLMTMSICPAASMSAKTSCSTATIDDLLLRLRGLVLVAGLLERAAPQPKRSRSTPARPNGCGHGLPG